MYLVLRSDGCDQLLQGTCTMLIESDLSHGICGVIDQDGELLSIAFLKQLLAQVIAERI